MDAEAAIKEAGQYYLPVIYRRVIMALHEEPQTVMQLASNIPVDRKSIAKALRNLRDWGVIRVLDWRPSSRGPASPIYEIGAGRDAKKTAPLTNGEKCKRYRANIKVTSGNVKLGVWGL